MPKSIDIPLTNGQVAAILTVIEFILTSITCYCIKPLVRKYFSQRSKSPGNSDAEKETINSFVKKFRSKTRIAEIITFLIAAWLTTTVFLLELFNFDSTSKLSSHTIPLRHYLNMNEPVGSDVLSQITLPKNFELDTESIEVVSDRPCNYGIDKLPMRTKNSISNKSSYYIYPKCVKENIFLKRDKSPMRALYQKSYAGNYIGFKLKGDIFSTVPNNPDEIVNSIKNKQGSSTNNSCFKNNVQYFLWPTIFNQSWDIGSTNSQELSNITQSLLCQKFSDLSPMRGTEFNNWASELASDCIKSIGGPFQIEVSIDHKCIKTATPRQFQRKDLNQKVAIKDVSTIFIKRNGSSSAVAEVCFNATLRYQFTMIPAEALKKHLTTTNNKFDDILSGNGNADEIFNRTSKKLENIGNTTLKNVNAISWNTSYNSNDYYLESPLMIALPTKIRIVNGTCENVNSVLGLAAFAYFADWVGDKPRRFESLTSQQQVFQAYVLSLSRHHYTYDSLFPNGMDREESAFQISKDFTRVELNEFFYLMCASFAFCLIVMTYTLALYLNQRNDQSKRKCFDFNFDIL